MSKSVSGNILKARRPWLAALCLLSFLLLSLTPQNDQPLKRIELSGYAQGTTWHAVYYAADTLVSKSEVDSILLVIDSALSIYKPYSRISAFNDSRKGIKIDEHFRKVIASSLETYRETNGLFDITVLPLVEAWGFGAKTMEQPPDSASVRQLMDCIGSDRLKLKKNKLKKSRRCIRIDVNGIAQGYSVDVVAAFLEKKGIRDYLVEIGGELRVQGKKQPENQSFRIGIEAPPDSGFPDEQPLEKVLVVDSGAVTTSGNYRKYHESNGKKISHLIDPRTGYSVQNELISVTVYAKDAMTADAYDNALMLMGLDKALSFVESREDMAAFFIYRLPDGNVADTASSGFYRLIQP
ncbi:MAG TPA: FAD:protein FMN transferase [Flavitalea sp.]|nr:FAD:protein FMN transferase [Flavitalea sp.]